jgi:hypothetical protein
MSGIWDSGTSVPATFAPTIISGVAIMSGVWDGGTSAPAKGDPLWGGNPWEGATGATGATGAKGDDGVIQQIIAGTNITVDNSDPHRPVIASTSSGSSWNLEQW